MKIIRMLRTPIVGWAIFLSLIFGPFIYMWWKHHAGETEFEQLIQGSSEPAIIAVEVDVRHIDNPRVLRLDDPISAEYFTQVFRNRPNAEVNSGSTYTMTLYFASGHEVDIGLYLPDEGNQFTISHLMYGDMLDDPDYFGFKLPTPMPDPVRKMINNLRGE